MSIFCQSKFNIHVIRVQAAKVLAMTAWSQASLVAKPI